MRIGIKNDLRQDLLLLASLIIGNAVFLHYNIFRCFNMLDMGAFLDASWRIYKGQSPYLDFVYYSGPLHLYMNTFFFMLFGFGKAAIWAHVVAVHSIMIGAVFFLMRRYAPLSVTVLVSVLTTASFYWSVSHPWHDVSAHFWGSLAILALAGHFLSITKSAQKEVWFWAGLFSIMAFLVKTNLGALYVAVIGLVFLVEARRQKWAWIGYAAGLAAGIIVGLILIKSPQKYFEQSYLWNQYLIKQRLSGLVPAQDWLVNYYWVAFVFVSAAVAAARSFAKSRPVFFLFVGVTLIGIYATNTGGMIKPANNFLWGIQAALGFLVLRQIDPGRLSRVTFYIRAGLCVWSVILSLVAVRYGLELKVWTYLFPRAQGDYALRAAPLTGWKFYRFQGEPLDAMVEYIKAKVPAQHRILNLTDMYIVNALTDKEGYRQVPFMFLKDTIPLPGPAVEYVRSVILSDPPEWIVMDVNSFVDMASYLNLHKELLYAYRPAAQWGVYVLIKRVGL